MDSIKTVRPDGAIEWRHPETNELHREDGPAVEWMDGSYHWYLNGEYHRVDGPAIELADGYKEWLLNGKLHRTDGPAIEYPNGHKDWYLNNKKLTKDQFERWYLVTHLKE